MNPCGRSGRSRMLRPLSHGKRGIQEIWREDSDRTFVSWVAKCISSAKLVPWPEIPALYDGSGVLPASSCQATHSPSTGQLGYS